MEQIQWSDGSLNSKNNILVFFPNLMAKQIFRKSLTLSHTTSLGLDPIPRKSENHLSGTKNFPNMGFVQKHIR